MLSPRGNSIALVALCSTVSALTNFLEAYSNSYPNTSIETFANYVNGSYINRGLKGGLPEGIYTWVWSMILNIWFLGYLVGAFFTPYCSDTYGRKAALLIANIMAVFGTVVATIGVAFPVPEVLFIGRIIQSISAGMSFGTLILFLQETTPTQVRGLTSFLSETVFLAVNVIGMGFGMDVVFGKNLPLLIGIGLIPGVASILIVLIVAETPKFLLLTKNDRAAAMKALIYYRGESEHNDEILDEMMKESDGGHGMPVLVALKKVFQTPHLRGAFILGCLIVQVVVGIWPIIYLSTDFLSAHFSPLLAQVGSFLFILFNFVASIPGMFAVERFGRRAMLIWFGILNTIFLALYIVFDRLSFYVLEDFKYGCLVSLVAYGCTYGAALGPIAWFITSELVPQRYRSLIQSMVFSFNTVMNFIFSFVTLPVYRAIGVWGFIPLFIVPSTLCLIYITKYLPETKGREIHEIVDQLRGSSARKGTDSTDDSDIESQSVHNNEDTTQNGDLPSTKSQESVFTMAARRASSNIQTNALPKDV